MKIAIIGYGKMGRSIEKIATERGHEIVLKITSENQEDLSTENLAGADVAIEFTSPESAFGNISICLESNIPTVSGSTGWTDRLPEVEEWCRNNDATFLYSSNFSLGVNLFFKLNKYLAGLMGKYDAYRVRISETHHTEKKDAPSGTAITLANQIIALEEKYDSWTLSKEPEPNQIQIKSYREKDVPGTHSIYYKDKIDEISIEHRAFSRAGFAQGAVIAAEFIHDKKGVFTMDDVLFPAT